VTSAENVRDMDGTGEYLEYLYHGTT